ncbi:MAG TPA: glycosyltransferase family 39 protein [Polyangia bacterium]
MKPRKGTVAPRAAPAAGTPAAPAPTPGVDPAWLTPRVAQGVLVGILALYALLTLPYLTTCPPIDNVGDESWMMSASAELLRTGRPVAALHAGTSVAEKVSITVGWVYQGLLALFLAVFGVHVWAGRLLSWLCGGGALGLTYLLGRRVSGRLAGLIAALLLGTNLLFAWHSREVRPEAMLLLAAALALYLFLRGLEEERGRWLLWAGLTATLAVEIHPNGGVVALTLVVLYAAARARRLWSRPTLLLAAGLAAGTVVWLLANVLPGDASSFADVHGKYVPPVLRKGLGELLEAGALAVAGLVHPRALGIYRERFGSIAPLAALYAVYALVVAGLVVARRRGPLLLVAVSVPLVVLLGSFLVGQWTWAHHSVVFAAAAVTAGAAFVELGARLRGLARWLAPAAAALVLAGVNVTDVMARNLALRDYDFGALVREVREAVPPGATVVGDGIYWHAFRGTDRRFSTFLVLEERCPHFPSELRARGVEYLLADDSLMTVAAMWCSARYPQEQILPFLRDEAVLVKHLPLDYPHAFGRNGHLNFVRVYRVLPEGQPPPAGPR